MTSEEAKIAVLIDAENIPSAKLPAILEEIAVHGHIITKRAYGDFSSEKLRNWKNILNENAVIPVQQFSYTQGKNSSDSAMIIDAMDLLYTQKYDTFVLVSSDSDFTKLASRLRESQIFVYGVGEKKTPVSFEKACDDFIYIENLKGVQDSRTSEKAKNASNRKTRKANASDKQMRLTDEQFVEIYTLLMTAYEKYADDTGWAAVSAAGSLFKRLNPGFDPRDFGFRKLSDIIAYLNDDFEIKNIETSSVAENKLYRPIEK